MTASVDLSAIIDHTLLRADATRADIEQLCREAVHHRFAAVCVNPCWVTECRRVLGSERIAIAAVVDFPLGAGTPDLKAYGARRAVEMGASELDVMIDIGAMKSGDPARVEAGLRGVREAAPGITIKAILETAMLSRDENIAAARLAMACGADFVKTSTGFAGGATPDDVRLLRETVGSRIGVKASGGIRTLESALALIEAGASRLGTSSGVAIVAAQRSGASAG